MDTTEISSSGVTLAVQEHGPRDAPTVVLVHGFPDTHRAWRHVVAQLADDHRVVTYDVRGAGGSSSPSRTEGYRVGRLVDDLVAVLDHALPAGGAAHLVGHDWGSVQLWDAVLRSSDDPRLLGRIASFTSISGPGLDLFDQFVRSATRERQLGRLAGQLRRSWYVVAFQVPLLPDLVLRRWGARVRMSLLRSQRLEPDHFGETFVDDAVHGLGLYRANGLSRRRGTTSVPVQLVVPTRDAFLAQDLYEDIGTFAPDLRRVDIDAGHWVVATHPREIAALVREFVHDTTAR